ncbi:MAG: hypothetical protein LRY71_00355 [Bacillaceae bacterium]|nr:hypothetical protein [Bacillaceae bacterium]
MSMLNLAILILVLLAFGTLIFWLIKRTTKKNKFLILAVPVLLFIAFGITFLPHRIVNMDPADVAKITVFNGGTGKETVITNREDIDYIINNLNDVTFRKGNLSLMSMGFSFRTTIYDQKGRPMQKLTIESQDTIDYKWFFYQAVDQKIDYKYIENLVE